jgi:hypothetical protein
MGNCAPEDSMEKQLCAGFGELHMGAALVHPKPAAINRESQRGAGPRRHPVPVPTELDELGHNLFGRPCRQAWRR